MTYQAGDIGLRFTSDLRQVRRDLKDLRSEAERPINVGGSSGASVNGGRGLSARAGSGRVRFSSGRTELNEAFLRRELTPEYSKETGRYAESYRRRQQQQLAAIDRAFGVIDKQASAEEGARARIQATREQRVNSNWERAGLAAQNKAERMQAAREQRVNNAFDRAGLSAQNKAERDEQKAKSEAAKAEQRRARAAEKLAGIEEKRVATEARAQQRTQNRSLASAQQTRMLRLRADLALTDDPYQRQSIISSAMSNVDPDSSEGLRLQAMYNRAGKRSVFRRFMDRFEGYGGAVFAYTQVRGAISALQNYSQESAVNRFGSRSEILAEAERQAQSNPFDVLRQNLGPLSQLPGASAIDRIFPNLRQSMQNITENSDLYRVKRAQGLAAVMDAQTQGIITARGYRQQARESDQAAGLLGIRDEFQRRRQAAINEDYNDVMSRAYERQNLVDRRNSLDVTDPQRAVLNEQISQFDKNDKPRSLASNRRRIANLAAIDYDQETARIGEQSALDSLGQRLERQFRRSRITDIEGERDQALRNLEPGTAQYNRSKDFYFGRITEEKQRQSDEDDQLQLNFLTRNRQLDALFARSPMGAEVAGIVGQTKSEALSLSQQGYTDEAAQAQRLGIRELQLTKRNYLESFRGEQIDLNRFDIDNRRDQENPTEVLKTIQSGIEELSKTLNGSGDGGGFIDKLKTMLTDLISN